MSEFAAPLEGLTAGNFIERDKFFRMGRAPLMVDILPEISGVDFDSAWQRRVEAVIDPQSSLTVPFISRQDLIAAKLSAGRAQDIADVAALKAVICAADSSPLFSLNKTLYVALELKGGSR